MKAILTERYGPPEIARLAEVPVPVPADNEVLIRVHAATVNRTDCGFRSAQYFIIRLIFGLFKPKHKILGSEFAGEIVETGKKVIQFKPGNRVLGYNDSRFGAHAEFMIMRERDAIVHMPAGFSYEDAAPVCEGAHYALNGIRAAKIRSGQNVLVYGATGAIGSSAVQLLVHFGARVTAVCNSQNVVLVRSLGAERVIDYEKEDFTKCGQVFDFVLDAVGKSSFGQCKPLMSGKGIYISTELGRRGENIYLALLTPLRGGKKVIFPIPPMNKGIAEFLRDLAERGEFKPVIDRTYPLEQIVDAYRYVESGQKTGNVLISLIPG